MFTQNIIIISRAFFIYLGRAGVKFSFIAGQCWGLAVRIGGGSKNEHHHERRKRRSDKYVNGQIGFCSRQAVGGGMR